MGGDEKNLWQMSIFQAWGSITKKKQKSVKTKQTEIIVIRFKKASACNTKKKNVQQKMAGKLMQQLKLRAFTDTVWHHHYLHVHIICIIDFVKYVYIISLN